MMNLLRKATVTAEHTEAVDESEPTVVAPPLPDHDLIVELQAETQRTKDRIAAQVEYIKQVQGISADKDIPLPPSVLRLAKEVYLAQERISASDARISRIGAVIVAGCEPTTLNTKWYCGLLEEPRSPTMLTWDTIGSRSFTTREQWPCNNEFFIRPDGDVGTERRSYVYQGPMPVNVFEKLAEVKNLFDEVRVYSPIKEHFKVVEEPRRVDPVLVGMIAHLDQAYYFEIARWDVNKDLAAIFTK